MKFSHPLPAFLSIGVHEDACAVTEVLGFEARLNKRTFSESKQHSLLQPGEQEMFWSCSGSASRAIGGNRTGERAGKCEMLDNSSGKYPGCSWDITTSKAAHSARMDTVAPFAFPFVLFFQLWAGAGVRAPKWTGAGATRCVHLDSGRGPGQAPSLPVLTLCFPQSQQGDGLRSSILPFDSACTTLHAGNAFACSAHAVQRFYTTAST